MVNELVRIEAAMAVDPPAAEDSEEERLFRAFVGGQAAAFEALYRRLAAGIHGLAYRLSGRRSEAEELTQEVFVRAWQQRQCFESGDHLRNWLRRVAVNLWINQVRRVRPESLDEDADGAVRSEPEAPARAVPGLRLDLERALARLPPRLRAVLLLYDLYGLRHEEIADTLEISPGASKVQLHRGRARLKELLR